MLQFWFIESEYDTNHVITSTTTATEPNCTPLKLAPTSPRVATAPASPSEDANFRPPPKHYRAIPDPVSIPIDHVIASQLCSTI